MTRISESLRHLPYETGDNSRIQFLNNHGNITSALNSLMPHESLRGASLNSREVEGKARVKYRVVLRACLQGERDTLALAHFLYFSSSCLQGS